MMSKRDKDRKEKKDEKEVNIGLGGLFKGIGSLIDLVVDMAEKGETEFVKTGEGRGPGQSKVMYGFSVKLGAAGMPKVESFGNVRQTEKGPVVEEVREPMADVFEEKETVQVLIELPGVEEFDIKVEAKGDVLLVSAEGKHRKYSKEILLPCEVKAKELKKSYRNGILEIILPKCVKGDEKDGKARG